MSTNVKNRQGLFLSGGGLLLLLLLVGTSIIPGLGTPSAAAAECESLTAESPAVGNDCNEDPVSPEEFQDWQDVYRFGADGQNQWYFDCLQTRLGVSRDDVRRYSELEGQGHELRGIVISNTNVSDEAARDKLANDGVEAIVNVFYPETLDATLNERVALLRPRRQVLSTSIK